MAKNIGKQFENNFKKSVLSNVLFYRPPDSAQSFGDNTNLRFSAKSPCDCFLFSGELGTFWALEQKSVGTSSISFEREKTDKGVIHKHQIDSLIKFATYDHVVSGFLLDFRLSNKTYFCMIDEFVEMINHLDKKSFNEKDLFQWCNPTEIMKTKLKVNYKYDVDKFLRETHL